jgi:type IV secretory pathway VirB10-like protein
MHKLSLLVVVILFASACKKENKTQEAPPTGSASVSAKTTETPKPEVPADPAKPADPVKPADPAMPGDPVTGAAAPRPASVTDAQVALADKLLAVMTELGDAMKAAGTDCKAATAAVNAGGAKVAPVMAEAETMKEALAKDPAAKEWFDKTYGPKFMASMGPMSAAAQACSSDKDFMAAMASMPMGKKKKVDP